MYNLALFPKRQDTSISLARAFWQQALQGLNTGATLVWPKKGFSSSPDRSELIYYQMVRSGQQIIQTDSFQWHNYYNSGTSQGDDKF